MTSRKNEKHPSPFLSRWALTLGLVCAFGYPITSRGDNSVGAAPSADRARIRALRVRVDTLRDDLLGFWLKHGLDLVHGGGYGLLDREGKPVEGLALGTVNGYPITSTDKGIVQQGRHLWSLSTYYQQLQRQGLPIPEALVPAIESLRSFILDHMKDPSDNRFYFMVSRDGNQVVHPGKNFYGNMFAMYGLSKHYEVFGDESSREQAIETFLSYDEGIHDAEFGGYDETGLIPVKDNPKLPSGRLSKTLDTLLHAIECLVQLHQVVDNEAISARIASRIVELLEIAAARTDHEDGAYLWENFDTVWNPRGNPILCYGHQLEIMWLAIDALERMREKGVMDPVRVETLKRTYLRIGEFVTPQAYDEERGGLYLAGWPNQVASRKDKHWWAQAEALNGFWYLYQHTGQRVFLDKLEGTVAWVEQVQRDPVYGGWFAFITPEGQVAETSGGFGMTFPGSAKGTPMKASYHDGRATMFLSAGMAAATE